MALVPGFEYDVFVSYTHVDDAQVEESEGWISRLVRLLKPKLRQRLANSDDLKIFLDNSEVTASFQLDQLLEAARGSALFLAVGSPNYVARDNTLVELRAFLGQVKDPSRLFLIEYLPLRKEESYPALLRDNFRAKFWELNRDRSFPVPLTPRTNPAEYTSKLDALAVDISDKLHILKLLPKPFRSDFGQQNRFVQDSPLRSGAPVTSGRSLKGVLIAQTTDELEDEADQIRSFLRQFYDEVNLLPTGGYPQGGDVFRSGFRSDLEMATLFVQLLGKHPGRKPPDLPEGYTRFQFNAARQANVRILQWRRPDLDCDSVQDLEYREMLKSETVIASGLEALKNQILKEVRKVKTGARPIKASTVFINADARDLSIAREVERECVENALTAILPMSGSPSEATRTDLAENLIDCDILVFIYGDTTQEWIRSQLKFFNKVRPKRDAAPKLLAICSGPPPKPDIGISFPNARLIKCPSGWDIEPLRKLLLELVE